MNIQELNQKLQEVESELGEIEAEEEMKKILKEYHGRDEVISFEKLREQLKEKKPLLKFLTKIPSLDRMIEGFSEGDFTVITAPTGQGKTTFCQSLTKKFSDIGLKSLWFSYEVLPENFLAKFGENLPIGYTPAELTGSDLFWIEKKIIEAIAKFDIKIVFIDHLHSLLNLENSNTNISFWVGDIIRKLKKIALKYRICLFLVAHLTKTKFEEKPGLEDIRDSSFITQEADNVIVMWRKIQSNKKGKLTKNDDFQFTNQAIVSVEKNRRTGQLGTFKLILKDNLFEELDEKIIE